MEISQIAMVAALVIVWAAYAYMSGRYAQRKGQEREDEWRAAAATRGWTVTRTTEPGGYVTKFSGITNGVQWEADWVMFERGHNRRDPRGYVTRWHGQSPLGITAPIVAKGVRSGLEITSAIDIYFGDAIANELKSTTLQPVDGHSVPGFVLMAGNMDEANRLLAAGLHRALLDAVADRTSLLSEEQDRPWIVLRSSGISIARIQKIHNVDEVERFVDAGVYLTTATLRSSTR